MYKCNTLKEKEFSRSDFSNNVALTYEPKSENDLLKKKNKCCKTAWIKIHFIINVAIIYLFTWLFSFGRFWYHSGEYFIARVSSEVFRLEINFIVITDNLSVPYIS